MENGGDWRYLIYHPIDHLKLLSMTAKTWTVSQQETIIERCGPLFVVFVTFRAIVLLFLALCTACRTDVINN